MDALVHRRLRRISLLGLVLAVVVVIAATVAPIGGIADAVPPCTVPQFTGGGGDATAAGCGPTNPPTTRSPTTTAQPTVNWSTSIEILDQTGTTRGTDQLGSIDDQVLGYWLNQTNTVQTPRTLATWQSNTDLRRGTVGATNPWIGPGTVQFRMAEQGVGFTGLLCRSQPLPAIPTDAPHKVHVLVPGATTFLPEQLDAVVGSLAGTVIRPDNETEVTVGAVHLTPHDGSLNIEVTGVVEHGPSGLTFVGDFTYNLTLLLTASFGNDTSEAITVSAPWAGDLDIEPHDLGDEILWAAFGSDHEQDFHDAVLDEARTSITDKVANNPGVRFFSHLGYTASMRAVTLSETGGLTVLPALCKFD